MGSSTNQEIEGEDRVKRKGSGETLLVRLDSGLKPERQPESKLPATLAAGAAIALVGYGLVRGYRWLGENIETEAVGFVDGRQLTVKVVRIDGKPVERITAQAFKRLRRAARLDGVFLRVVSGFRTNDEQAYLYNCFKTCSCNDCNYAEAPGYSKHQNGRALDLNTREAGVLVWLRRYAPLFGFAETIDGEVWHWEYDPTRDLSLDVNG